MKWSILIRTVPERAKEVSQLLRTLNKQMQDDVEVLVLCDNKQIHLGDKCQRLVEMATGEYISFIDDDDKISPDYISSILGLLDGVDAVGFRVEFWENGAKMKPMLLNPKFNGWNLTDTQYEIGVSTWMVVKRELAINANLSGMKPEDRRYMEALTGKLNQYHFVDKVLYYYRFDTRKTLAQGGQSI